MAPGTRGDAQDQGQTEVCIHFLNGRCRHGAACRRRHDPAAARPPCTYFQRGFCNRGDDCLFAHGPSDTAARLAPASQAAPLRRGPQTAPPMQPQRRRQLAAQLAAAAPPAAQGLSVWRYLDAEELNKKLDEEERLMEGYCSEDAPSSLSSSEDEGEAAAAGGEGGEGSRDSKRGQDSSARDARWRAWAARLEEWEAERERREIQLERRLLRKDADKTVTDEFRPLCWCETCQRGFSQPKALLSHLTSQHAGSQDALIAQLAAARECPCGRSFGSLAGLNSHIRAMHSAPPPEQCRDDAPLDAMLARFMAAAVGGYGSDSSMEEGACGFSRSEVAELWSQGVKPWDDDAWAVMGVLGGGLDDDDCFWG